MNGGIMEIKGRREGRGRLRCNHSEKLAWVFIRGQNPALT